MILSNVGFLSLALGLISSFAVFLCSVLNIKKNLLNLETKIYKFLTLSKRFPKFVQVKYDKPKL